MSQAMLVEVKLRFGVAGPIDIHYFRSYSTLNFFWIERVCTKVSGHGTVVFFTVI